MHWTLYDEINVIIIVFGENQLEYDNKLEVVFKRLFEMLYERNLTLTSEKLSM